MITDDENVVECLKEESSQQPPLPLGRKRLKEQTLAAVKKPKSSKAVQSTTATSAWERVRIDLIDFRHTPGFDTKTKTVMKWVLNIHDHFSRFSFYVALPDKLDPTVAEALKTAFDTRRYPLFLHCSNRQFVNNFIADVMNTRSVRIIRGDSHDRQTRSAVVRNNRTFKEQMAIRIAETKNSNWCHHMSLVSYRLNSRYSRVISKSPIAAFFRTSAQFERRVSTARQIYKSEQVEGGEVLYEECPEELDGGEYRGEKAAHIGGSSLDGGQEGDDNGINNESDE